MGRTIVLRPTTVISQIGDIFGETDGLDDDVDSTNVQVGSVTDENTAAIRYHLSDVTLAGNETVTGIRDRARRKAVSGSCDANLRLFDGGLSTHFKSTAIDTSSTGYSNITGTTNTSTRTESFVDGMQMELRDGGEPGGGRVDAAEVWVDVYTNYAPNAPTSITPSGAQTTGSGLSAGWTHSDPEGDAQTRYQVRVKDSGAVVIHDSGEVVSSGNTYALPSLADGSYTVEVRTKDAHAFGPYGSSAFSVDTATVVDAGPDVKAANINVNATLDGTVTWSPDGPGTTTWTKDSGPGTITFGNAALIDTTVQAGTLGTYVLKLTATDPDLVTTNSDTTTFRVNVPPVVDAGGPYSGQGGVPVALNGTVTDSDPVTLTWSANPPTVSFSNPNIVNPTVTASEGSYTLSLKADDGIHAVTDTATLTLSKAPVQLKMTATAAGDIVAESAVHWFGILPGETYNASVGFRHGGTSRSCTVALLFYALSGNLLSEVVGNSALDGSTLTTASVSAVAPAEAASVRIKLRVAAAAAAEVHYADNASLVGMVGDPEPTRQRAVFDFGTAQPGAGFQVKFPTLRGVAVRSVSAVVQDAGERPRR